MSNNTSSASVEQHGIPLAGEVDRWYYDLLFQDDLIPARILQNCGAQGLPSIHVTPHQGRLLNFLIAVQASERVLEIGTLGGYSTAWMALALKPGAELVTIEHKAEYAEHARQNLQEAGLLDNVDIRVGKAADILKDMVNRAEGPFDFVFLDADKHNNPLYLDYVLQMSRPGTLIFADNMVRRGKVLDEQTRAENIRGMQQYVKMLSENGRLESTAIQTVGGKIWDGFTLTRVKGTEKGRADL